MKPETRLDSAMFQLTPTRTRCDLVIIANGENEKVASGLLNPFLSHLKTAQEQIAKGGYSIVLEPNSESKHASSWFTKTTLERFVRFVSTPEVLERVNTIESEIIQIDEAIAIQSNTKLGLMAVDDHQVKPVENNEGGRYVPDADTEKAIVLYKPSAHQIESKESTLQEENSKVKLLRVLETRRTVLQKEQGMAFARAVAAGFDMDHMDDLISFADCFGASRLREACLHFVELWKRKHETVQWIEGMEMEAAEGISCPSGLQVPWAVGHGDIYMENSVKTKTEASSDRNIEHMADLTGDRRSPVDPQVPLGQNGYFQGQFQHPMYMQWPIHPPHGGSMFPPYPMPGMPYYPGYPGGGQFFQQPYVQMDNSSFSPAERNMHKRHSMDGKDGDVDSESITRSHDSSEQNAQLEMDREESYIHESRKKVSRTGKKRSGMVVIRNINYITSNREHSGDAESQSGSGSEAEEEEVPVSFQKRKHKDSVRSTKEEAKHLQAADVSSSYEKEESSKCVDVDNGNWQAFQNFLLSKDEDDTDRDMFPLHNDVQIRRRDTVGAAAADSIVADRSWDRNSSQITSERDVFGSNVSLLRKKGQSDESTKAFANNTRRDLGDHHDVQVSESEGRSRGFRRMLSDDFLTYGHRNQTIIVGSSCDFIAGSETEHPGFADQNIGQGPEDESFMVPLRTSSQTQVDRDSRTTTGLDLEFLSNLKRREDSDKPIGYVPDELSMIPERGTERSYDPAVDYEMQIQADMSFVANGSNLPKGLKDESKVVAKQEKKAVDKEKKNVTRSGIDKRKAEAMRNLKPTKSSPLAEAQARAERLRAFKADLQKAKKEQQDEQIKRLEALKKERQKRIAARSSSMQSPSPSQLTKVRQSTKVSPSLLKASKFSDSEAASPSPIPKMGARSGTVGSSTKVLKTSTPSVTRVGNGLTRSASSVPEFKKENGVGSSDAKATMTRLRRLSEPKSISNRLSDGKSTPRRRETNGLRSKISPVNRLDRAAILKNTRSSAESDGLGNKISPLSKVDGAKPSSAASFKATSSPSARPLQNKVMTNESTIGSSDNQVCLSSSVERKISDSGMCLNNMNETMIVDKSVLTIEHEVSTSHASKESKELTSGSHDGHTVEEKVKVVSDYAAVRVLPSKVVVNEIDLKEKQIKQAVDEVSSKFPRVTINEVQYQAPHARKSSLEDPCAGNSEYSKALPLISETSVAGEPVKAHVLESSWSSPSKPIVDGSDKSSGKESKGLKRLLKFGLRSHGSASGEKESGQRKADGDILDDSAPKGESGFEVHSLKNLISQDDTYSEGGTPHKASRSFSLLSPFRSKKAGQ
ncbi:COP1-interacting protein 7 [Nymphaea colorata]|nr:COP1-interacting protein 7 [Nymphaea colorata]XP_031501974.1 COP1-interacting protein 7 [Nymphaea colorata]